MNSFGGNQSLGQFSAGCAYGSAPASGSSNLNQGNYIQNQQQQQQQQQSNVIQQSSSVTLAAMQQFGNFASLAFAAQPQQTGGVGTSSNNYSTVSCLQKEIESLKKQNIESQCEIEKIRQNYTEQHYQMVATNMKLSQYQEQLEQLHKEKIEQDKSYKELKSKYDEKYSLFRQPNQSDERSLFCNECNFEVKSQVALFIHKLNHYFESSIPRHLQLSTRSFSTMPDDSTRFKYKCHCCEIDSEREFARHEIYVHIYQFHTFDLPFKCKFCFLYFTSKSYLMDHLVEKHSMPGFRQGRKGKRASTTNAACHSQTLESAMEQHLAPTSTNTDPFQNQLNSTLSLSARPYPSPAINNLYNHQQQTHLIPINPSHQKKLKFEEGSSQNDISELFQQLVGETLQDTGVIMANLSTVTPVTSNITTNNNEDSFFSKSSDTMKRDAEIQQIMNDLDGDDNLNCKYPGCKFVATTKNHLKFHMSAHLMSKYKCPYCTFVGNRIVEIKRHILKSSKHTDQHVFLCPGCDFASDCEKTFREHYSRYHDSNADVSLVIDLMFSNDSKKVGKNMLANNNSQTQNKSE